MLKTKDDSGKQVLDDETAEKELKRIISFWEVNPEGADWENAKEKLLLVIKAGRLRLDEKEEKLILKLVKPIPLENGDTLDELSFQEPTAKDLRVLDKTKDQEKVAAMLDLATKMTGVAIGLIDRMKSRDTGAMGAISGLFF
jgi:hypothetical protein